MRPCSIISTICKTVSLRCAYMQLSHHIGSNELHISHTIGDIGQNICKCLLQHISGRHVDSKAIAVYLQLHTLYAHKLLGFHTLTYQATLKQTKHIVDGSIQKLIATSPLAIACAACMQAFTANLSMHKSLNEPHDMNTIAGNLCMTACKPAGLDKAKEGMPVLCQACFAM